MYIYIYESAEYIAGGQWATSCADKTSVVSTNNLHTKYILGVYMYNGPNTSHCQPYLRTVAVKPRYLQRVWVSLQTPSTIKPRINNQQTQTTF